MPRKYGAVQYKHYRFIKTSSAKWSQVTVPLIVNSQYGVTCIYNEQSYT